MNSNIYAHVIFFVMMTVTYVDSTISEEKKVIETFLKEEQKLLNRLRYDSRIYTAPDKQNRKLEPELCSDPNIIQLYLDMKEICAKKENIIRDFTEEEVKELEIMSKKYENPEFILNENDVEKFCEDPYSRKHRQRRLESTNEATKKFNYKVTMNSWLCQPSKRIHLVKKIAHRLIDTYEEGEAIPESIPKKLFKYHRSRVSKIVDLIYDNTEFVTKYGQKYQFLPMEAKGRPYRNFLSIMDSDDSDEDYD